MAERSHAFLVRGETGRGEEVNLSDLTDDQLWAIVDNPGIICREIERRAVEEKGKECSGTCAGIEGFAVADGAASPA